MSIVIFASFLMISLIQTFFFFAVTESVLELIITASPKSADYCADALIALLRKAWSCHCFSLKQKAEFNNWRYEITTAIRKYKFEFLIYLLEIRFS